MRVLITGIGGQDGHFIAKLSHDRGASVLGLSSAPDRARAELPQSHWPRMEIQGFDFHCAGNVSGVVAAFAPDLIFNCAAKATGQGMFEAPQEMMRVNAGLVLDILEAIRNSGRASDIGFCQASSSEMFGHVTSSPQSEATPFRPKSPYGAAKLYAHNLVRVYRDTYGLRASSAILYNHESWRRPLQFVTRKITNGAAAISLGLSRELALGSLDIERDWGYAPEYANAMFAMAAAPDPADYVIATGRLTSIRQLCEFAFGRLGLDYRAYVRIDSANRRPVESHGLCGDPAQIARELGWRAERTMKDIVDEMVDHDLHVLRSAPSQ